MKASDLFVKALESEGVEFIFGVPGEENLDFLNSLHDSQIRLIVTRHEQAAGFMAAREPFEARLAFMEETIYPAERVYYEQQAQGERWVEHNTPG